MNKIVSGIMIALVLGGAGCGLFKKGTRKKAAIPVTDSTMIGGRDSLRTLTDSAVAVTNPVDTTHVSSGTAPINADKKELIAGLLPLWNSRISYNTFSGKAKVHFESPKDKQDFTATIRMEKDKKIWVSIVALGVFEAARALITPDTIIVVDRLHKEVMIRPFAEAGKLLPVAVDFSTLQSVLLGDALHTSTDAPTDATAFGGGMSLTVQTKDYQQQLTYNKADSSIRQQQVKLGGESGKGPLLLMQYGDYSVIDSRMFSSGRVINVQDTAGQTNIELQFNKVEFDQPLEFSISIPSKYTRK